MSKSIFVIEQEDHFGEFQPTIHNKKSQSEAKQLLVRLDNEDRMNLPHTHRVKRRVMEYVRREVRS